MIFLRLADLTNKTNITNWNNTILKSRNLNEFKHLLTSADLNRFEALGKDEFYFWGDVQATINKTEKVEENFPIIWYGKKKKNAPSFFHTKAIVEIAIENEDLGNYFWDPHPEKGAYKYVYAVKEKDTSLNILYKPDEIKKKDGKDSAKNRVILSGHVLKDFNDFNKNDKARCLNWFTNDELRKIDNGLSLTLSHPEADAYNCRALKRNTPIPKAWIYQISFVLDGKKMKYVGQENVFNKDNKFEDSKYKSSSLVFWHIRKILGLLDATLEELEEKLNYKKHKLIELIDTTKGHVNDIENELIEKMYEESKEEDFMPINYTGSNSPKYK